MNQTMFSIIIPTYNRVDFLSKAIKSVILQTYTNWELIIVDDGSTDNTKEKVASFNDKRIRYFWQENQERSAARNNGIKLAKGEYVCFLDSDDYFLPNHLKTFITNIEALDKQFLVTKLNSNLPFEKSNNENWHEFILTNTIHPQQVCIKKDVFKEFLFNSELFVGEDLELWLRIIDKYKPALINVKTVDIVNHDERTVSYTKTKTYLLYRKLLLNIFNEYKNEFSLKLKRETLSQALFNISKSYNLNNNRLKSIFFLLKSIFHYHKSEHIKSRLYYFKEILLK